MLQIWDWQIAGESAYRLMLELVFLSFMLWFLEYRIFDKYLMPFLNFSKNTIGMFLDTVGRKKSRVLYRMKTDFEYVDCEDPIALIKDNDPKNEAERVKKLDSNQAIKVENLRKSYVYNEFAVNDLSYAVQYGECFALLGVTGAGKTTTFKCLTGEEWGDEGNLSLGGFDLATKFGRESSRKLLGYCP